jgi:hypothetical protein
VRGRVGEYDDVVELLPYRKITNLATNDDRSGEYEKGITRR